MNLIKKYLKKKKVEKEKRKQEEFLNTRIPLDGLYIGYMYNVIDIEYINFVKERHRYEFCSIKILKKQEDNYQYKYVDPITSEQYRIETHYNEKLGDIVVGQIKPLKLSKETLKRQYLTIADIIELNEEINEKMNKE